MLTPPTRILPLSLLLAAGLSLPSAMAGAETAAAAARVPELAPLNQRASQLKQQRLELERDLLLLEDALVPAEQRVVVFLSVTAGQTLLPESVRLTLGEQRLQRHFTPAEAEALRKGGAIRLLLQAMPAGQQVLEATLSARDSHGAVQELGGLLSFQSGAGPRSLELQLAGRAQPELRLLEWR